MVRFLIKEGSTYSTLVIRTEFGQSMTIICGLITKGEPTHRSPILAKPPININILANLRVKVAENDSTLFLG